MTRVEILVASCLVLLTQPFSSTTLADEGLGTAAVSNTWAKVKDESRRALVIGKIRAAMADRKDLASRYIQIRYDGTTVTLIGFVPDRKSGRLAEELARKAGGVESITTFWEYDDSINAEDPYNTFVSEQASDVGVAARVLASLSAPDVTSQFKNAEILYIRVIQGKVTVYIVANAAPSTFDLAPHVTPIEGVSGFAYQVVKAN